VAAVEKPKRTTAKAKPATAAKLKVAAKPVAAAKPKAAPKRAAAAKIVPKYKAAKITKERKRKLVPRPTVHPGALAQARAFPVLESIFTRRSRRFALGAELTGPLAFRSDKEPIPLAYEEEAILVAAATGISGIATDEWRQDRLVHGPHVSLAAREPQRRAVLDERRWCLRAAAARRAPGQAQPAGR
jgi:hypothetical protein